MNQENLLSIHASLKNIIYWIRNSDCKKEDSLFDLLENLPKNITIDKDLRYLINNLRLELNQIISLYEYVESIAFKFVTNLVPATFKKTLDHNLNLKCDKYLECKKEIKNEDLCVALRRFITRYLIGNFNETQSLSGYLELKMDIWPNEMNEKMMKEYIETFQKMC